MAAAPSATLRELSEVLWRERRLLDLLHFKLEVERMLLDGDHRRWIGYAGREVDLLLDELGHAEMERAVVAAQVGDRLGLGAEPSLAALARAAPAPWDALLDGHRRALRAAAAEVRRLADDNATVLRGLVEAAGRALVDAAGCEQRTTSPTSR